MIHWAVERDDITAEAENRNHPIIANSLFIHKTEGIVCIWDYRYHCHSNYTILMELSFIKHTLSQHLLCARPWACRETLCTPYPSIYSMKSYTFSKLQILSFSLYKLSIIIILTSWIKSEIFSFSSINILGEIILCCGLLSSVLYDV